MRPFSFAVFQLLAAVFFALQFSGCKTGDPSLEIGPAEALLSPIIIGSASIFMQISNSGPGEDSLTGARLDIPRAVAELHDMQDGKMVKSDGIAIPARATVQLRPFGQHIMIFRLPKEMKAGDTIMLSLSFRKSGVKTVSVTMVNTYSGGKSSAR